MLASKLYAPTLRETPAEAEIISHQLMLKAGMIHKVAAGVYSYLPLSWKVIKKIEEIIREEMDAVDGQEICMPIVLPAEAWQQSGRWQVYGDELWRVKDRHGRDFCLGPTHEEIVTLHVRNDIRSYKQLPQRLYQINTKFRDERRPRFGLMRGREFIMKDLYSFDLDQEGLETSYQLLFEAYTKIFTRCGLDFRPVEADSGAIGGKGSHEFMALADSGEAEIAFCSGCDYAASTEIASTIPLAGEKEALGDMAEIHTPDCKTIDEVAAFLKQEPGKILKAVCYEADGELVMVLIRGNRQVNEIKLQNTLNCLELDYASDEAMSKAGLVPGYLGPLSSGKLKIIADDEVPLMINQVCGAGKDGYHLVNVNPGRDYQIDQTADLRIVEKGEACPKCGESLAVARGIEVGQVFKLQTKYSSVMGARYVDEKGDEHDIVMGSYGIGVGRTMAAVIEQSNDENGIIWPMTIAPYQAVIVPVNDRDEELTAIACRIYQGMQKAGVEVVLDDRKERPGVKFNDADLIGYPIRVIIGKKTKQEGIVEIKLRKTGEMLEVPEKEVIARVVDMIREEKEKLCPSGNF